MGYTVDMTRRGMRSVVWVSAGWLLLCVGPTVAADYRLTVDTVQIDTGTFTRLGIGYNMATPGPVLHFREGDEVTIHVTNRLAESTSVHWHGLIVPYDQDGVPGLSYGGIAPGTTFTYRFPIVQHGTYWFHSHTGLQEHDGAYGAIIIAPKTPDAVQVDRDYVVQLTDAHPHAGKRIMRHLKMTPEYYNRQQRTLLDFLRDVKDRGLSASLADRRVWGAMRMTPTDIEDVQGFTPLINGKSAVQNWTGHFIPGERVRLRIINASAMTYYDVRIPGLSMTVVAADGNPVHPVTVDELRIAVAETYDVMVQPETYTAYTIFAESIGRTAFARGTLAPSAGMMGAIPPMRTPPRLTVADMGVTHAHQHSEERDTRHQGTPRVPHDGRDTNRPDVFYALGSGLAPSAANGGKFLSYADLHAQQPRYPLRAPTREIEIRLTGNMQRYTWSINGVPYPKAEPIQLRYGERVRFRFVNETMMLHPMHLHGMWLILDTGQGQWDPLKHVVSVAPGTTVYAETEVDATGQWALHCHLAYHSESGMFRTVVVTE